MICCARTGTPHFACGLASLALLVLGGAITWNKYIRDYFVPRNFGVVKAGAIYRSGRLTSPVLRQLHEDYHLRTIIDLSAFEPQYPEADEQQLADELGIERFRFSLVGDGTGDPNNYVAALKLMTDPARQPVLVHCSAGAQRTSAAVILYRHIVQGMSVQESYPESFEFKHDPDDFRLLAYLADNIDVIRASFETGRPIVRDASDRWVLAPAVAGGAPAMNVVHAGTARPETAAVP